MPYRYSFSRRIIARAMEFAAYLIWLGSRVIGLASTQKKASVNRILVIEPFQLGDVISLSVILGPLKNALPESSIFIWTQPKNRCVYENDSRVSDTVGCAFPWAAYGKKRGSFKEWATLFRTIATLRSQHFELGIDTRGDVRSQILLLLAGCQKRLGCTDYSASNISLKGLLLTHPVNLRKVHHRFIRNYELISAFLHRKLPPLRMPAIDKVPLDLHKGNLNTIHVVIHPSGGWKFKRWNYKNWRILVESLSQLEGIEITLVGTIADFDVISPIITPPIPKVNFRETSYRELKAILSAADLFIGLDSGPMNLASAMNVPVLALFGPGDSSSWYPLSNRSRYIQHIESFPCNPCFQTTCIHPGSNCMDNIFVSEVVDVAKDIIKNCNSLQ